MNAIRKRRNGYAVLFAACTCAVVWFVVKQMTEVAFILGGLDMSLLILLVRQNRLLYDASLIWDNRILAVPSAVIYTSGGKGKRCAEETVVSTFGTLIGSSVYKWGCDGVRGVRLNAVEIDRARVYLTFGDEAHTMRVELLHGMVDEQAMLEVKQKLRRETGVTATVAGW